MKIDLVGKIKKTPLPKSKALFPMFEAVVNSFQAIEDASESGLSPSIDIVVNRHSALPGMHTLHLGVRSRIEALAGFHRVGRFAFRPGRTLICRNAHGVYLHERLTAVQSLPRLIRFQVSAHSNADVYVVQPGIPS